MECIQECMKETVLQCWIKIYSHTRAASSSVLISVWAIDLICGKQTKRKNQHLRPLICHQVRFFSLASLLYTLEILLKNPVTAKNYPSKPFQNTHKTRQEGTTKIRNNLLPLLVV